jgi:hypothetical protein
MTIIAKPVVDNEYWILKQDDQKVGNIQAVDDGYQVTIANKIVNYKTIPMLCRRENVEFEPAAAPAPQPANQVHGFEVQGRVFNALWNVQLRLPLFTKDTKSKSWFAAGWYRVRQHRVWRTVQQPKLITLQRYEYRGPFHTREQANESV